MSEKLSRRRFSESMAIGSFWSAIAASTAGMAKLIKPAALPEASSRVKLGHADDFPPGTSQYLPDRNLFVFRDGEGVFAISAVCTHLGCIVKRRPEGIFECPCHGSRFDGSGDPTAGPAPRGLDWLAVTRAPSGVLYADASIIVPKGTRYKP